MRGDLLFFHGHGALYERIIERGTNGPYCHVEVDLGSGYSIGALGRGVVMHRTPDADAVAHIGASCDPKRLSGAFAWLRAQVGDCYSIADIFADGMKILLPARTPFLVAPSAYDCSKLAACFCASAGYPLPAWMYADMERVSPNDLGRAFGLIK